MDIKRQFSSGIMAAVLPVLLSIMAAMPVYAGQWVQDGNGWRWQNDDGSYPENDWQWLDGNQDGMANRINGKSSTWSGEESEHQRINQTSSEAISTDELAQHIIELVNAEREKRGKAPLSTDCELKENAAARAEEACIYYSHTRPDKSEFDTAITVKRYSSAENLAKLYPRDSLDMIAEAAVKGWMDSERHRKQMLDDRWTETGAGVCESGGYIFISQIFVKGM